MQSKVDGILIIKNSPPKRRERSMKNRMRRRNPESEDSEEKLRGKIRDISKQLEAERRYSRALEKRLKRQYEDPTVPQEPEKSGPPVICGHCGKEDTMEKQSFYTPNGDVYWMICKLCQYKEKIK